MANGVDFTYTIGARLDTQNLVAAINKVQQDINKQPLSVQIKGDINARVGDIANFAKVIGTTTDKIESVKVVYQEFYDKLNNTKLTVPTKEVTTFKNELGNTVTKVRELDTTLAAIAKADKKGFDFLGTTTATAAIGETSRKIQKDFDAMDTSVKKASTSADEFLAKTKSMSGPGVEAGRALAEQIQRTSEEYRRLKEAGDVAGASTLEKKLKTQAEELKIHNEELKKGAAGLQNFGSTMQRAIKQSFAYALAMRAVRLAQQKLNEAFKYAIDLNTEMTKIQVLQVEGAKTAYEINNLADSFNRLAKEMGASTLEVAKGSVEWLRQGKTIEETSQLLKSTLMLSKLGNLETADATEKLTSTLNGYKMSASEATSVVDKLVAVDNVAATSVKELTTALQYSAAIANETGVSFEQLVSYIGTISETTRQNAESIGQGMKTMLTRMQDIKGGKLDEDGLGINNVEIALKKANVELRDSRDSFRDFSGVLEELAGKWGTLSETEQAFIAKSIAGIRQVNMFTVLMQNMDRALELQEVQFSSAGLAASRYQIYMESLEAKLSQFKATLQGLYQSAITSGLIEWFVEAGIAILDFIEAIGGLKEAIIAGGTIALFAKLATSVTAITKAFTAIKVAMQVMRAGYGIDALSALTAGVAMAGKAAEAGSVEFLTLSASIASTVAVVAGVVAVFGALAYVIAKNTYSQKELAEQITKTNESLSETKNNINTAKDLQEEYDKLSLKIATNAGTTDELKDAQSRLYEVQKQLKEILPEVTASIDAQGNTIIKTTGDITNGIIGLEEYATKQEELKKGLANRILFSQSTKDIQEDTSGAYNWLDKIEARISEAFGYFAAGQAMSTPFFPKELVQEAYDIAKAADETTSKINLLEEAYNKLDSSETAKEWLENADTAKEMLSQTIDAFRVVGSEAAKAYLDGASPEFKKTEEWKSLLKFVTEALPQEEAEKAGKEAAEAYRKAQIAELMNPTYGGESYQAYARATGQVKPLNESQATTAVDIGVAGSQAITDYLITERIPSLIKAAQDLSNVFDTIGQKQLIAPEQIDRLGNFGVSVEHTVDGLQVLKDKQGNVISSQEDLLNIIKLSESEYTSYSPEQQKIIDMYIEQALATEKASEGYKNLESAVNALSSAYKEQSENGEISISTAMNLVEAGMAEAVMWDTATGSLKLNEEAMIRLQKAKIEMAIADQRLITTTAGFTQAQVDAAQAMISAYQEIYNALGQESPIANLSPVSGSSSAKQEDPRIKEQEEIIEGLEDEIDLYEDEKDAIKKSQDQYHDWIDLKKKALELTKEENDYLKEQSERTTNLEKLKKEIAMLELDNTEEARAKRLELEEQAAELEKEITENTEERRYDLQMQALENLKDAFDAMIEKQIEAIDLVIEGIRDQIEAIRDIIEDLKEEGKSGSTEGSTNHTPWTGAPVKNPEGSNIITVEDAQGNTWTVPVASNGEITQRPGDSYSHGNWPAFDIAGVAGQDIYASRGGVVTNKGTNDLYGNFVEIFDEKLGKLIQYSHMLNPTQLAIGQEVKQNDIIGNVGDTGKSTGPHLDWAVTNAYRDENGNIVRGGNGMPFDLGDVGSTLKDLLDKGEASVNNFADALDNAAIVIKDSEGKIDTASTNTANDFIRAGVVTSEQMASIMDATKKGYINWSGSLSDISNDLNSLGITVGLAGEGLLSFYDFFRNFKKENQTGEEVANNGRWVQVTAANGAKKWLWVPNNLGSGDNYDDYVKPHSGGLINQNGRLESHHTGDFAGNLRSNEVFAKLLKGEYVATEGQMDNFLKNVLPTIATNIPTGRYNQSSNITVSMPINVNGNLDKSVLPDIKKIANQVIEEINRSLIARGYVRPANNTLS